ncbi:hypothetical protein SLEP1_g34131 [Rubroshorea leprosula]|uniref:Uncharacterized protein n=1 Tax=Rubroshorea leprosula TaxID=152421 RepID=A0AAV5KIX5_9ROSI|nr:hypothetical protein SLEP1_g34131 [Rubroshorea leprosula]
MGHNCCNKQKVKRGLWSPEEDEKLIRYITTHGHGSWSSLPRLAGLQRCGKSCRLRWINYLRPDLKRGSFTEQEEKIIIDVHRILGNRWAQIAKHLPGRTDNEVKNFWNSCIKKKLIAQGIDPQTHNLISPGKYQNFNNNYTKPMSTWNSQSLSSMHEISVASSTCEYQNPDTIWTTQEQTPQSMPISFTPFHEPSLSGLGGQREYYCWGNECTRNGAITQVNIHDRQKAVACENPLMELGSSSFDFEFVESTLITNGLWSLN